MKLKTLKELEKYYGNEALIDVWYLKQEAIKWVKSDIQSLVLPVPSHSPLPYEMARTPINFDVRNWIKVFFNITEEDLK